MAFIHSALNVSADERFIDLVSSFVQHKSVSPLLQVNGRNLLSVDYDRTLRTEKIYDDHRKFLLKIIYDTQGHPTLWVPSSKLLSVNLTYSR